MVPVRPTSEQAGIKGRVFPKQNKDGDRAGLGWTGAGAEIPIKLKGRTGVDTRAYIGVDARGYRNRTGVNARAYMSYFPS